MERCSVRRLGGGGEWRRSGGAAWREAVSDTAFPREEGDDDKSRRRRRNSRLSRPSVLLADPVPWSQRMRAYAAARRRAARVLPRSVRVLNAPGKSATRCAPHATAIRTCSADASTTVQARVPLHPIAWELEGELNDNESGGALVWPSGTVKG